MSTNVPTKVAGENINQDQKTWLEGFFTGFKEQGLTFSDADEKSDKTPKQKKIIPEEKYLSQNKNPPKVKIEFFENIRNLKSINCYSNEGDKWRQSDIKFENTNTIAVNINEKFIGERGRINCSLRDSSGFWRWLGLQFVISEN